MKPIAKALAFVALLLAAIATAPPASLVCAFGAVVVLCSLLTEEKA